MNYITPETLTTGTNITLYSDNRTITPDVL
jgi:hypothetical protein